jgi:hypothetical protein
MARDKTFTVLATLALVFFVLMVIDTIWHIANFAYIVMLPLLSGHLYALYVSAKEVRDDKERIRSSEGSEREKCE